MFGPGGEGISGRTGVFGCKAGGVFCWVLMPHRWWRWFCLFEATGRLRPKDKGVAGYMPV